MNRSNHHMKYGITILLLWAISTSAQPILIDKVMGIVDDRIVLLSDIEGQYIQIATGTTEAIPADFKCAILDGLLTEQLFVAQSAIDSIEVTEEEVDEQLDAKIRYYAGLIGGFDELEKYYGKSIIEMKEDFRDPIREQLLAQRERASIVSNISVTPSEIVSYFNSIPKDSLPYFNTEMEIGELIIYPKVSAGVREYAKQKIGDLLVRARNGEDFATLAQSNSEDGSAENGGDIGFKGREELDPSYSAAAFKLKIPNEISEVVESAFGFHLIQLIERRGDRIHTRHILIRPKTTSYDLSQAGKLADSIYNLIQSGKMSFTQAVNKFSENATSKNNGGLMLNPASGTNRFEVNELGNYDPLIVKATDTMQVGSVSSPFVFKDERGNSAYRMMYLKLKTKPHQANLADDYDKMQEMALNDKQTRVITEWIEERIAQSYVYLAPDFRNCNELEKWISEQQ